MKNIDKKTVAIILAGGSGSRMKSEISKQRMLLLGRTVLYHSVHAFDACPDIDSIIVVSRESELEAVRDELSNNVSKPLIVVSGGKSRAESAKNGFLAVPEGTTLVAFHDAARCLISPADISRVIDAAGDFGASTAVALVHDTIKVVDDNGFVKGTLDRGSLRRAMTPQAFSYELYRTALLAAEDLSAVTDDNMLVEAIGGKIKSVLVSSDNIKITEMADLEYAEFLMYKRGETK